MAESSEKRELTFNSEQKDGKTPSPTSNSITEANFGINEKALLRKLDLKLLPPLTLLYLLSFLDRSNGTGVRRTSCYLSLANMMRHSWKCSS